VPGHRRERTLGGGELIATSLAECCFRHSAMDTAFIRR